MSIRLASLSFISTTTKVKNMTRLGLFQKGCTCKCMGGVSNNRRVWIFYINFTFKANEDTFCFFANWIWGKGVTKWNEHSTKLSKDLETLKVNFCAFTFFTFLPYIPEYLIILEKYVTQHCRLEIVFQSHPGK